MIIKEIKVTAKKAVIKYITRPGDPIERVINYDEPLPHEQRSHIEAVAEYIIQDAEAQMEHEKDQGKFEFEVRVTAPVEPSDGDLVDYPDSTPDTDWNAKEIPMHEDTQMPDFARMEKAHLEWYVGQAGDKDALREEVEYHFGERIGSTLSLEKTRERALKIIFKNLLIK